jgi:hypothetical protein
MKPRLWRYSGREWRTDSGSSMLTKSRFALDTTRVRMATDLDFIFDLSEIVSVSTNACGFSGPKLRP